MPRGVKKRIGAQYQAKELPDETHCFAGNSEGFFFSANGPRSEQFEFCDLAMASSITSGNQIYRPYQGGQPPPPQAGNMPVRKAVPEGLQADRRDGTASPVAATPAAGPAVKR
jgi:hypothetical protein